MEDFMLEKNANTVRDVQNKARENTVPDGLLEDRPREECGVFGIYAPGRDVARLSFFALYALQHRGQEGAGIATSDGRSAYTHKAMGLVSQVFNEDNLRPLKGYLAIGHNRYSTTGSSVPRNVQPYLIETIYGPLGVAHNGNITNARTLRQRLLERGVGLSSSSDTEVLTQILASPAEVWASLGAEAPPQGAWFDGDIWVERIRALMRVAEGAYTLVILTRDAMYAVRDPHGLRPLCLGELESGDAGVSGQFVVASESCALQTIGARYVREIEPGEIVRLDGSGLHTVQGAPAAPKALCSFEFVYFARPDSLIDEQVVHAVRQRLGRQLARESFVDADIVVPVPDSSTPAALGYALESGVPYGEGLIKNRYIGRTFIQPDDDLRRVGIKLKFNPLSENIRGKRVVLVDDSIVRGNTAAPLVQLMRDGGASEVHLRVSSPPVRHPCFMGVDMATHAELIAFDHSLEEIRAHTGADSLAYLSLDGMITAIRGDVPERGYCAACFSGHYPIQIPDWLFDDRDKLTFDRVLK
jgi:amidophosphoribosyltransferase